MKKMFTLFAGLLMAAAVFAADRRPTVTLNNNSRQYKVVIDGRAYFGDNVRIAIDNFWGNRQHTVKVYEMRRGFFQRERLVDATTFVLGRNDVMINIQRDGDIMVREMRGGFGFPRRDGDDRGWNDNDRSNNRYDQDHDDQGRNGRDRDGHDRGF